MMEILETLRDLVRINSVNAFYLDGPGESACANYVADYWKSCGIETWSSEVLPGRPNVIARLPGKSATQRLILEAHMDTVSTAGMSIDPFDPRIEGGRIYGRGACDTKAGLAGMMSAVARAKKEQLIPPCEVWMAAVIDEEYSCQGVLHLCRELRADAAVVAEPTEMKVVVASKGVLRWRILAHGKSAHSSKPHLGIDAIYPMAKLLIELELEHRKLSATSHPLLGPATANVGLIRGGVQVNFVPDQCAIEIGRRLLPSESVHDVLKVYQACIDRMRLEFPLVVFEMEQPMLIDYGLETPIDRPIVQTAIQVLERLGLDSAPVGVPFGSDASKLHLAGIPSILFGPGSIDQAHASVEFVSVEQVQQAAEFYYSILSEFGK
jgi:acetylornithine deacetylase